MDQNFHNTHFLNCDDKIVEEIIKHDNIFIFHHINPDGDCLGAQFGLKKLINLNYPNKNVFAIGLNESPFDFLDFKQDEFYLIDPKYGQNSLGILVDANSKNRICESDYFCHNFFQTLIRIDHHPEVDDIDFKVRWVDPTYAACCEQIIMLAKNAGWKIDLEAAKYLYLGLNTDTGRFNYENVSARTFMLMAWLLEKTQLKPFEINYQLAKRSEQQVRYTAEVLNFFQKQNKVCWYTVKTDVYSKYDLTEEQASCVNLISNIDDSMVWIFFIEIPDDKYRVSMRSNSVHVNTIAKKFQGGGHNLAAGARINRELKHELLNEVFAAVNLYEKTHNQ